MADARVIIADEHPLFREALRQDLSEHFEQLTVAEAGSLEELNSALGSGERVDLLLLDLGLPGIDGCAGMAPLRAQYPELRIVAVSATEDPATMRRAGELGAAAFIPKSQPPEVIREAIDVALKGGTWTPPVLAAAAAEDAAHTELLARLARLTPQQTRVLTMLGEGLLNKQIAYELNVSEATVKAHVSAILQKLEVESRTQAVIEVNRLESRDWQKVCAERLRG